MLKRFLIFVLQFFYFFALLTAIKGFFFFISFSIRDLVVTATIYEVIGSNSEKRFRLCNYYIEDS